MIGTKRVRGGGERKDCRGQVHGVAGAFAVPLDFDSEQAGRAEECARG